HDGDREIDRRNDDGEGERKGREQAEPAEDKPGLVAVPDRRNRIHDQRAVVLVACEAVEDADAEIEAIEHDVIEDGERDEDGPDRYEIEHHGLSPLLVRQPAGALERLPRTATLDERRRLLRLRRST